jgi:hypothetical protein
MKSLCNLITSFLPKNSAPTGNRTSSKLLSLDITTNQGQVYSLTNSVSMEIADSEFSGLE